jgi:hypothetical protein
LRCRLRLIHPTVGLAKDALDVRVGAQARRPDAQTEVQASGQSDIPHCLGQPGLRDATRIGIVTSQDDPELVSADPRDHVDVPDAPPHAVCDLAECRVAEGVSERIVARRESVNSANRIVDETPRRAKEAARSTSASNARRFGSPASARPCSQSCTQAADTFGSNLSGLALISSIAASKPSAGRHGRCDAMASTTSATAGTRAPRKVSAPFSPWG